MKQVVIYLGFAVMIVSIVFAQTQNQTTLLSASEAWKDVRRAIDKGNAQWSEGWAKGDPAMVAAIFADDGVQLAVMARSSRALSKFLSIRKQQCRASIQALK